MLTEGNGPLIGECRFYQEQNLGNWSLDDQYRLYQAWGQRVQLSTHRPTLYALGTSGSGPVIGEYCLSQELEQRALVHSSMSNVSVCNGDRGHLAQLSLSTVPIHNRTSGR